MNDMQGDLIKMRQASAQARPHLCGATDCSTADTRFVWARDGFAYGSTVSRNCSACAGRRVAEAAGDEVQAGSADCGAHPGPASLAAISAGTTHVLSVRVTELGDALERTLSALQDDWYRRAELALGKGEEDLAREALKRRKAYEVPLQIKKTKDNKAATI